MAKERPLVSIIIPVYNGADYVGQAIDSALAQTYSPIEIIVVNDGSCDNGATERLVLGYGDKVRYFAKENGGVATAFNYGIQQMRGEYFSWLSHDDLYKPNKVEAQMELYDTYPPETILYSGYELFYGDEVEQCIPVQFGKKYSQEQLDTPLFPVFRGLANGCTILFHKSHFERVGLFEPQFRTTQDYNLWFRMFRGAKIHYCSQENVRMRQHDEQGSKTIPSHLKEANALWIWMCENATDAEKSMISGTPYLFYKELLVYLRDTPYEEAKDFIKAQMDVEQKRWSVQPEDEEALFTYVLVKQVERLQERVSAGDSRFVDVQEKKMALSNFKKFFVMAKNEGVSATIKTAFSYLKYG